MNVDALVLAGGKSRRMGGTHKGNLKLGEETFQEIVIREFTKIADQIFLSYGVTVQGEDARCQILMDEIPDCGPLGGLVSGLKHGNQEFTAVSPCDLPFMKASFYECLKNNLSGCEEETGHVYKGVVPVTEGRIHPLTALYRKSALEDFERELMEGHLKVTRVVEAMDVVFLDLTGNQEMCQMLKNINTPEDYEGMVSGMEVER
ncbi:MAG: molybdenum cofactor guanylyltransferase [Dorea sp.]|nr:molybdenum cofactor guanylyltransferase [Dorea sp.]